ncbi:hypothetical protein A2U01_0081358, partial [Trifolium medium]|nr:hypothetical protein [Trifolium medium]
ILLKLLSGGSNLLELLDSAVHITWLARIN